MSQTYALEKTDQIRPNPANARTHSKKQIRQIAASIQAFGFTAPLLIDEDKMILAGHARYEAAKAQNLALLPVGYADGFNRLLSNRGHVLIRGHRAPIAGRVSMDQTIVDVTGIPAVAIGDEVVLLGKQGGHALTAWDLADLTGTIPWEVLCAIGGRVPRLIVP